MSVSYTKKDVHNWKVIDRQGNVFRDAKGKPLNSFDGYASANKAAVKLGGVAVRV